MPESKSSSTSLEIPKLISTCSSRRQFTPPDHWLVTSHVDMIPFIQAAVYVPHLYYVLSSLTGIVGSRNRTSSSRTMHERSQNGRSPT